MKLVPICITSIVNVLKRSAQYILFKTQYDNPFIVTCKRYKMVIISITTYRCSIYTKVQDKASHSYAQRFFIAIKLQRI